MAGHFIQSLRKEKGKRIVCVGHLKLNSTQQIIVMPVLLQQIDEN
jgi:hypothetical protein